MQKAAEQCQDVYGVFQEALDALDEELNDLNEIQDSEDNENGISEIEDISNGEGDDFDSAVQPGSVDEAQVDALILKLNIDGKGDGIKSQERRNLEQGWLWFHPPEAT